MRYVTFILILSVSMAFVGCGGSELTKDEKPIVDQQTELDNIIKHEKAKELEDIVNRQTDQELDNIIDHEKTKELEDVVNGQTDQELDNIVKNSEQ